MSKQFPLQEYEIWYGTWNAQGSDGWVEPVFVGKEKGRNFQDACMRFFLKSAIKMREKYDIKDEYYNTKEFLYTPHDNRMWGIKLFSSKEEAFKDFRNQLNFTNEFEVIKEQKLLENK